MSDPTAELRRGLRAWVEGAAAGAHPPPAALAAYRAGELAPAEEARVRRHLLGCRECVGLLLEIGAFEGAGAGPVGADPMAGADQMAEAEREAEAAWVALLPHLRREGTESAPVPFAPRPDVVPPASAPAAPLGSRGGPRWLQALAASLLAAAVGLGGWVVRLRQEVKDLSSPQVNAPILDLYPSSTYRSEGEAGPSHVLSPNIRLFTLVLNPPAAAPEQASYRVEIIRADGSLVWRADGLEKGAYGSLVLTLPRRLVGPGRYRVRLYGREAGASEPIAEFPLWIDAG